MHPLTDAQLQRYARHIVLPDIGGRGQQKLLAAKVLVVGAGGLGAPCLQYLAAAGVGTLGIVDDDQVDLSNLQRQIIHRTSDVGRLKVESAADAIRHINPDVNVVQHGWRLTVENAAELVASYDIIADGSDSFATRFAVNAAAIAAAKPLVSAAVGMFDGQLSTFKGYLADAPCYRCFVPEMPVLAGGSCAEVGIIGALTGVMGTLQALETIREIVGFGDSMTGRLMLYDAFGGRMRTVSLSKNAQCVACGHG